MSQVGTHCVALWGYLWYKYIKETAVSGSVIAAKTGHFWPYGYIYDTETQLYYLQSRYYDPELRRFISADAFTSTGQSILGNNMFAYCGNNPINRDDPTGQIWAAIGIGTIASVATSAVTAWLTGEDFTVGDAVGAAIEGFVATSMTVLGIPPILANPVATFCGEVYGKFIDNDTSAEAGKEILNETKNTLLATATLGVSGIIIPKYVSGKYLDLGFVEETLRELTYQPNYINETSTKTIISKNFWGSIGSLLTEIFFN